MQARRTGADEKNADRRNGRPHGTRRVQGDCPPGEASPVVNWLSITHGIGDMNCDGRFNNFDVDPFVLALTDPASYAQAFACCDIMLGDVDGDGLLNNFDVDPFVALLTLSLNCP